MSNSKPFNVKSECIPNIYHFLREDTKNLKWPIFHPRQGYFAANVCYYTVQLAAKMHVEKRRRFEKSPWLSPLNAQSNHFIGQSDAFFVTTLPKIGGFFSSRRRPAAFVRCSFAHNKVLYILSTVWPPVQIEMPYGWEWQKARTRHQGLHFVLFLDLMPCVYIDIGSTLTSTCTHYV